MTLVSIVSSFGKMSLPPVFSASVANTSSCNASSFTANLGGEDAAGGARSAANMPFDSGSIVDTILATTGHASPLAQLVLFVYRLFGTQFGLDPSMVLAIFGFLWGAFKIGSQIYDFIHWVVDDYFMSTMFVSEDDEIHRHLMKWLSQHPSIKNHNYLMAQTVWKSAWEQDDDETEDAILRTKSGEVDGGDMTYLNFSNQAAQSVRVCWR